MPLITVIIPVYNLEKFIGKCLDSILSQTYKNLEIIVIDDCSTDNSLKIINGYSAIYKNIKVIHNSQNMGVATSRNLGLNCANGDYIYFIDGDDWIHPETLSTLLSLIKKYETQIATCNYKSIYSFYHKKDNNHSPKIQIQDYEQNPKLLYQENGMVWNRLYEHDLIDTLRFPDGLIFEDMAFTYPVLTKAGKCVKTSESFYNYRRHLSSITLSNKLHSNERMFDIFDICEKIKENCIKLNTYSFFQKEINELTKAKELIALMECNTWLNISQNDRLKLINYIYQYLSQKYDLEHFYDWECVKACRESRIIYDIRIKILLRQLEMANNLNLKSDLPLEEAKQIIKNY